MSRKGILTQEDHRLLADRIKRLMESHKSQEDFLVTLTHAIAALDIGNLGEFRQTLKQSEDD